MLKVRSVIESKRVVALSDFSFLCNLNLKEGINKVKKGGKTYYVKIEKGDPVSLSRKEVADIFKEGGDSS